MVRFRVRSLMFITALVAAWAIMMGQAKHGPTLAGFAGFVLYTGLLIWGLYRAEQDQKRHHQLPNARREGDGERPAA